jgi:hypothetical protein
MANNLHGPWVGEKTGLTAVRAQNGYYLCLGDKVAGLGDGVGMFWRTDGTEIEVDTEEFSRSMWILVESQRTLEVYFHEEHLRHDGMLVRSIWSDRTGDFTASKVTRMVSGNGDRFDRKVVSEYLQDTQNDDLILEDFCVLTMDGKYVYSDWEWASSRKEWFIPEGES